MAKVSSPFLKLKGVVGEMVFTDGTKQGPRIRKRPVQTMFTKHPKFKEHMSRAGHLNKLAGQVNYVIQGYYPIFAPSNVYPRMLSLFHSETSDNRFLLLRKLQRFDVNPAYRWDRMASCDIHTSCKNNKLKVELKTTNHATSHEDNFDSYCYEVILLAWTLRGKEPRHEQQFSDWIKIKGRQAIFDFEFDLPKGTQHWLLCLHQRVSKNDKASDNKADRAMQIREAGTLLKSDLALLKERGEVTGSNVKVENKKKEEKVRVKARGGL